jgi:hypothetical protein
LDEVFVVYYWVVNYDEILISKAFFFGVNCWIVKYDEIRMKLLVVYWVVKYDEIFG